MPYDSNGVANITRQRAVTGQTVQAAQVNVPFDDTQAMLSQVLLRSGVAPMTGALNMNGFSQTNVGDPTSATDGANKEYVDAQVSTVNSGISSNARKIETVNVNRLALLADKATSFRVTGSRTITLTAAATLLANWWCEVWAVDGVVTIDPDAAETINGNSTLILNAGQKAIVFCTGTVFFAFVTSDAQSGVQLQGYSFGLALSNNASDAANDIDITSGKAAADTSPFSLMVLNSAITKRIDALWAAGSGNGGLDTGGVAASGTYYIWLIQRSDTGVADALFSLSSTAPTMPTSYDRKRLIGLTVRSSSVNGPLSPFSGEVKNLVFPMASVASQAVSAIPPAVRKIRIKFDGVTKSAAGTLVLQLGTSAGISNTNYRSSVSSAFNNAAGAISSTTGFLVILNTTASHDGWFEIVRKSPGSMTWMIAGILAISNTQTLQIGGTVVLTGELTQLLFTPSSGTISGDIAVEWEF